MNVMVNRLSSAELKRIEAAVLSKNGVKEKGSALIEKLRESTDNGPIELSDELIEIISLAFFSR